MPRLPTRFQIMPAHLLRDFGGVKVVFWMLIEPVRLAELGSVDIEAREEKTAEGWIVRDVRRVPGIAPERGQFRGRNVLRTAGIVVIDGNVVASNVDHGGRVGRIDDLARDVERVHGAAVDVLVYDRRRAGVVLVRQIGAEAAEASEDLPLVVDDVIASGAEVVVKVLTEVIRFEVI